MIASRTLAAAAIAVATCGAVADGAPQPVPALQGHVTDMTGALDAARRARLEDKLAAFEARKGAQIAVLLVPGTAPESIDQYGIRVAEQWRIGRAKADDGAILLVALRDRAVRIEVGYGLEGVLSDAVARRILAEDVAPRFRAGDIAGGLDAGTDRMISVIGGEALPAPDADDGTPWLVPLGFLAVVAGEALRRLLDPLRAAALTAGATGIAAWWLAGSLLLASGMALAAGLAALTGLATWLAAAGGRGGGGFGGRGGGFGGGGASGRW